MEKTYALNCLTYVFASFFLLAKTKRYTHFKSIEIALTSYMQPFNVYVQFIVVLMSCYASNINNMCYTDCLKRFVNLDRNHSDLFSLFITLYIFILLTFYVFLYPARNSSETTLLQEKTKECRHCGVFRRGDKDLNVYLAGWNSIYVIFNHTPCWQVMFKSSSMQSTITGENFW